MVQQLRRNQGLARRIARGRTRFWYGLTGVMSLLLMGCSLGDSQESLPVNRALGGAFTLQSTRPDVVGVQDFAGQIVLLNFGFTSCPDVCPMVLARLQQLMDQLGESAKAVQVVFITVDPTHDTVTELQQYLRFFSPDFVGFTGSEADIHTVARQYGAVIMPEATAEAGQRRFSHSDFVYLLDQAGRVRKLYATDDSLQVMKQDIESLRSEGMGRWEKLLSLF